MLYLYACVSVYRIQLLTSTLISTSKPMHAMCVRYCEAWPWAWFPWIRHWCCYCFSKKNKQAQVIQKTTITKITTFQGQQSPKSQHFRGINHNISGTTIIDITTFQGQRSQTSQHVRDNNHNYYKFSGTTITKITTFQGQHSRNSQHFRDTYHKNHNIVVIVGPEILCFLNHLNLLTS